MLINSPGFGVVESSISGPMWFGVKLLGIGVCCIMIVGYLSRSLLVSEVTSPSTNTGPLPLDIGVFFGADFLYIF